MPSVMVPSPEGGAAVSIACAAFGLAAAGSQAEGQTARQHQG